MNLDKTKKWAMDIINEYDIKQKRKQMIENVAMQKAKKIFTGKTGLEMTPSMMEDEARGIKMSKNAREYLKNKERIGQELKTKMKQKGVY